MVTFSMASGRFDYISVQGQLLQANVSSVSFVVRGVFPDLPSRQYDLQLVASQLKLFISHSYSQLPRVLHLLPVVHSQLCVPDRPRAVDFEYIYTRVKKLIRQQKLPTLPLSPVRAASPSSAPTPASSTASASSAFPPKTSAASTTPPNPSPPYPTSVSSSRDWNVEFWRGTTRLALYLALAYHALGFVRLPRSPFAVVSSQTMYAVNKVMYALTQVELDHGSSQLVHGNARSGLAKTLQDFLDHWALWNDSRLARAARAVLESCDGRDRKLDSARALSNVLSQLQGVSLFPWIPSHSGAESSSSPPASPPSSASLQRSFTSNLIHTCTLFDNQTAASYDRNSQVLSVYIPVVPRVPSPLKITSPTGISARSVRLGGERIPLVPRSVSERYEFKEGVPRQSLKLSVHLNSKWTNVSLEMCEALPITECDAYLTKALVSVEPIISDHELQLPIEEARPSEIEEEEDQFSSPSATPSSSATSSSSPYYVPSVGLAHVQAVAGRIAGSFMASHGIQAPFVITTAGGTEVFSSVPGNHERIGSSAYVPISRPFDSAISLLAQRILLERRVPARLFGGYKRSSLASELNHTLVPQLKLNQCLEHRDLLYWTLCDLQEQLRGTLNFHIFRCTLLEDSEPEGHPEGQLLKAFCYDLGIRVEVFVPAHTEQMFYADQVIGTEILELDPLLGLFIVSM